MQIGAFTEGYFCPNLYQPILKGKRPPAILKPLAAKIGVSVIFFILALCLGASAQTGKTVTLKGTSLPLQKVLETVRKQTGYRAAGNKEVFVVAKPVTIDVKDMPLTAFLEKVFFGQPLNYEIVGRTILVSKGNIGVTPVRQSSYNATEEIKGRVLNEKNEPVMGATVTTTGGPIAVITNDAGFFSLYADKQDLTLVVSAIGYQRQEVKADPRLPLNNIVMKVQVQQLSEVVVENVNTGYQLLSKERATGAFSKPDMEVVNKRASTMDLVERLEGLVPGMVLSTSLRQTTSRYNGSTTRKSIIRGAATVNNVSDPLYVVNGVIVSDFSALNPDDIGDVTVLKDAAAAAIWGARASNGVIVVTTKSGDKNKRLSVAYNGFLNYAGMPYYGKIPMMNSRQYIQAAKETFDPVAIPWESLTYETIAPHDKILYDQYRGLITADQANKSLDSLAAIDNSNQIRDIWQRPAFTTNHTISLSGGNSAYTFYGSLGYTGVNNNNPGSRDNSYKLNFTQTANIGKRVNVSLNTSLINRVTSGKNLINIGNDFLPYQLFLDPSGNALPMSYLAWYSDSLRHDYEEKSLINLDYYPADEINKGYRKTNSLFANITANIAVSIWKGLRFSGSYGYQMAPGTAASYIDNSAYTMRQTAVSLTVVPGPGMPPIYNYPMTGGVYTTGTNDSRNWTVRNQLIYEVKPRNGEDMLLLQAGQEAQETYLYNNTTTILGYQENLGTYMPIDWERLLNGVPGTVTGYGFLPNQPYFPMSERSRFTSWYGLASYTYNRKYSLDLSWRQDYSSQFGSDLATQDKPVWSVGGKWQLGKEAFMKSVSWINELAVRSTYGITGNSPYTGAATTFDVLRAVNTQYQPGAIAGKSFTLGQFANRGLAWESTRNINFGIDFSILYNRLRGGINVYSRVTTDLLGSTPVNPFTGQSSISGNLGKLTNRGIELSLQSDNIRTADIRWTSNLQLSYNRNKLVSFTRMNAVQNTASNRIGGGFQEGYPLSPVFAYRFAGLDNMGDPQIYVAGDKVTKTPGAANVDDVVFMGTRQAPYNGSLGNTITYRNLSLTANIVFASGALMRRPVITKFDGRLADRSTFTNSNYPVLFLDRWKKPGDEAFTNVPSFVASSSENYSRRSTDYYTVADINIVSADYIKLRDVTLNYALPAKVLELLRVQSFGFYVQASNFLVWAANKDKVDPSWQSGSPLHSYTLGVNLSF